MKKLDQVSPENEVAQETSPGPVSQDEEGTIKVNLSDLTKPQEEAPEANVEAEAAVEQDSEIDTEQENESVLEEVQEESVAETDEQVVEQQAEELEEQVEQALVEAEAGIDLPENIQKVVEFINETGLEKFLPNNFIFNICSSSTANILLGK